MFVFVFFYVRKFENIINEADVDNGKPIVTSFGSFLSGHICLVMMLGFGNLLTLPYTNSGFKLVFVFNRLCFTISINTSDS